MDQATAEARRPPNADAGGPEPPPILTNSPDEAFILLLNAGASDELADLAEDELRRRGYRVRIRPTPPDALVTDPAERGRSLLTWFRTFVEATERGDDALARVAAHRLRRLDCSVRRIGHGGPDEASPTDATANAGA